MRLYLEIDQLFTANKESRDANREVQGYECRFSDGTLPCKPELARMTNEQLEEYAGILARNFPSIQQAKMRLLFFEAANIKMLDTGFSDVDPALKEYQRLRSAYPDTFLVPTPKTK
jgi:hypothetical protein